MKILALGRDDISHPRPGYPDAVLLSLSALSARGHEVIYVPHGRPGAKATVNAGIQVFLPQAGSKASPRPTLNPMLLRIFRASDAYELLKMLRGHDHDLVANLRRNWQPDLVLHEGPDNGREPRRLRALGIPLVERFHEVGTHSYIENLGTWEEYTGFKLGSLLGSIARKLVGFTVKLLQRRLAASADQVIAVSERDRRVLKTWGVKARTVLLPYKVPPLTAQEGFGRQPPDVLIPGSSYFVNQLEVRFAIKLASELPRFRFAISGVREMREGQTPRPLSNLEIGFLDPTTYSNYVRGARLIVIPLLLAIGLQTKVSEALAYGKPVLTTSLALQEFQGLRPWKDVAVEDDPRRFAESIEYLLEDERVLKGLSSGAHAYYSSSPINPEVHGEVLGDALERCVMRCGEP